MLRERHLAYSNPRPDSSFGPDERYVVLRFAPDKLGNPDGPGKYEVLVEDRGHNVIGWQYPLRFDDQPEARAEANKIWASLRASNAESLARAQANKERAAAERAAKLAAWEVATEQAKQDADWETMTFAERRQRIETLLVKTA